MINCAELLEDYQSVYGETLKKKLQGSLDKEQHEVVQLFCFGVFRKE